MQGLDMNSRVIVIGAGKAMICIESKAPSMLTRSVGPAGLLTVQALKKARR